MSQSKYKMLVTRTHWTSWNRSFTICARRNWSIKQIWTSHSRGSKTARLLSSTSSKTTWTSISSRWRPSYQTTTLIKLTSTTVSRSFSKRSMDCIRRSLTKMWQICMQVWKINPEWISGGRRLTNQWTQTLVSLSSNKACINWVILTSWIKDK